MGFIANTANTVYDDYNTHGVPSSGAKQPSKAAIRNLFANIDQAIISTPQWHNAAGDGVTDDTAAFAATIADGKNINLAGRTFRITSRLNFSVANQQIIGPGTLLFDGPYTDRLLDISADGVSFNGVDFDGNAKQVFFALAGQRANVKRVRYDGCTFKNVAGTQQGPALMSCQNQYGIIIDPNGTDFVFSGCTFKDIRNDNSGTYVTAAMGLGYCGGIMTYPSDGSVPASQSAPVSGKILGCNFLDISTVLAGGLSSDNQEAYQDADAIRLYAPDYVYDYFVQIDACYFIRIGKRAVKGGGSSWSFTNSMIFAPSSMQYAMVTAFKPDGRNVTVNGIRCYSTPSKPCRVVLQTHDANGVSLSDVWADYCESFWQIAPVSGASILIGHRADGLRCLSVSKSGIQAVTAFTAAHDWIIDGVDFAAASGTHGIWGIGILPSSGDLWCNFGAIKLSGMQFKIGEQGFAGQLLDMTVSDSGWIGTTTGVQDNLVLEMGNKITPSASSPASDPLLSTWETIVLRIANLPNSYYTASRLSVADIYGNRMHVKHVEIGVPLSLSTSFYPLRLWGHDLVISELIEYGDHDVQFCSNAAASYGPYKESRIGAAIRRTKGEATNCAFLYLGNGQNCSLGDVTDTSATTQPCVWVSAGTAASGATKAWMLGNIAHRSSHGTPVYDPGAVANVVASLVRKF